MKIELDINADRWLFLVKWFHHMHLQAPIVEFPLASVLLAEAYERYLKKFTWKPKTLKISVSEGMALHESLECYQDAKDKPDPFVTIIILDLFNLIENAFDANKVPQITPPIATPPEGGIGAD